MGVASVTVTKTNLRLTPGQTGMLEAKVNYDDGSADYNYRVAVAPEGVVEVRHSGAQIIVIGGRTPGSAALLVISNRNAAMAAEVRILVASAVVARPQQPLPGPSLRSAGGREAIPSSPPIHRPVMERPINLSSTPIGDGPATNTNAQFIDRLYQEILHRPADAVGRNYWTRMLDKRLYTRDEAHQAFQESPEAKARE